MIIKRLSNLFSWRKLLPVITILWFNSRVFSQDFKVSGTVSDNQNRPLSGVNVTIKGDARGFVTDADGRYTLTANKTNSILIFSYVGFKAQELPLNGRSVIDVVLEDNTAKLSEVVVVGYGSQSRATVSTSISKLDTKVLENIPYPNVTSAMQGTLPGVRVQSTTGQPGAPARVIIRGGTSINNPNTGGP